MVVHVARVDLGAPGLSFLVTPGRRTADGREFRAPLFSIFRRGVLGNTLMACWMMASAFVVGYSIGGMFPSYLQKDLGLPTAMVALRA